MMAAESSIRNKILKKHLRGHNKQNFDLKLNPILQAHCVEKSQKPFTFILVELISAPGSVFVLFKTNFNRLTAELRFST